MSDFEFGNSLNLLSDLLNPKRNEDESDEEKDVDIATENTYISPADINKKSTEETEKSEKKLQTDAVDEQDAEYFEKVNELSNNTNDWKKTPRWEVSYKQSVTASDVFLQMGARNTSTASCENMILKVDLPGESRPNIDLKVLRLSIEINSPKFFLSIPLPQPVNPQLGNARFDTETEQLIITLVMDRELDFVNF